MNKISKDELYEIANKEIDRLSKLPNAKFTEVTEGSFYDSSREITTNVWLYCFKDGKVEESERLLSIYTFVCGSTKFIYAQCLNEGLSISVYPKEGVVSYKQRVWFKERNMAEAIGALINRKYEIIEYHQNKIDKELRDVASLYVSLIKEVETEMNEGLEAAIAFAVAPKYISRQKVLQTIANQKTEMCQDGMVLISKGDLLDSIYRIEDPKKGDTK